MDLNPDLLEYQSMSEKIIENIAIIVNLYKQLYIAREALVYYANAGVLNHQPAENALEAMNGLAIDRSLIDEDDNY
jgi:hypothetical protein